MMTSDRGFSDLDEANAPAEGRPILAATRAKFGFVPSAVARLVAAPAFLRAFQQGLTAFERTSLSPIEREVVVLTLARTVECEVCVAMHRPILEELGARGHAGRIVAREELDDPRLSALSRFTDAVLARRGDVDAPTWESFLAAGFTRAQALEVVMGIGVYTMSTFANRLTAAPVAAASV
jgi:uncharacterized peroxidase-related enzyme